MPLESLIVGDSRTGRSLAVPLAAGGAAGDVEMFSTLHFPMFLL
jgi:hypothetical protein